MGTLNQLSQRTRVLMTWAACRALNQDDATREELVTAIREMCEERADLLDAIEHVQEQVAQHARIYDDLKQAAAPHGNTPLQAIQNLCEERSHLRGAMNAQDERERIAGEACGVPWTEHDCDWPQWVAEEVNKLRADLAAATAREQRMREALDLSQFDGHTPGPWNFKTADLGDEEFVIVPTDIIAANGTRVVDYEGGLCPNNSGVLTERELYANARLLAAAPTLLAEVRALLDAAIADATAAACVAMAWMDTRTGDENSELFRQWWFYRKSARAEMEAADAQKQG